MPPDLYKNTSSVKQVINEAIEGWEIERITFDNGIQIHVKNAEEPMMGLPKPEAIVAINSIKKSVIEFIKILKSPIFYPSALLFLILPKHKFLERLLQSFNRLSWATLSPYMYTEKYMTDSGREFKHLTYKFLTEMGFTGLSINTPWYGNKQMLEQCPPTEWDSIAGNTALILSHILEYDTAYRFRFEDVMSETTKEKLSENPRREIKRLFGLLVEREIAREMTLKMKLISSLLSILLLSPKIKKSLRKAILLADVNMLQLSISSRYWCLMRTDYMFMGKSVEERGEILKGFKIPKSEILK